MRAFQIKEDELPIIYEKGKRKAVIIEYKRFKEIMEKLKERKKLRKTEDYLLKVIGVCKGPVDLAKNHDKYLYGKK